MYTREYITSFIKELENYFFPNVFHKVRNKYKNEKKIKRRIRKIIQINFGKFFEEFKNLKIKYILDLEVCYKKDPSLEDEVSAINSHNGFYAIFIYRIAHLLDKWHIQYLPRLLSSFAYQRTSIDIHPKAFIGEAFFIDHGAGVVIGETTIIKDNVSLYQGVTLGAISLKKGRNLVDIKRHPTIENNVIIYANASILGGDTIIGENAIIGANCLIFSSVLKNTVITLEQKIIKKSK